MRRARPALGTAMALPAVGSGAVFAAHRDGGARSDRWTALAPAPLERTEVPAARIGHFVYVVGGFESGTGATSAALQR